MTGSHNAMDDLLDSQFSVLSSGFWAKPTLEMGEVIKKMSHYRSL